MGESALLRLVLIPPLGPLVIQIVGLVSSSQRGPFFLVNFVWWYSAMEISPLLSILLRAFVSFCLPVLTCTHTLSLFFLFSQLSSPLSTIGDYLGEDNPSSPTPKPPNPQPLVPRISSNHPPLRSSPPILSNASSMTTLLPRITTIPSLIFSPLDFSSTASSRTTLRKTCGSC